MGSQQSGELAGNFYCFLWQRATSSNSVCAVSQVCCSRPQISVLKHMRQTALGNGQQPFKSSVRLIGVFFGLPLLLIVFKMENVLFNFMQLLLYFVYHLLALPLAFTSPTVSPQMCGELRAGEDVLLDSICNPENPLNITKYLVLKEYFHGPR